MVINFEINGETITKHLLSYYENNSMNEVYGEFLEIFHDLENNESSAELFVALICRELSFETMDKKIQSKISNSLFHMHGEKGVIKKLVAGENVTDDDYLLGMATIPNTEIEEGVMGILSPQGIFFRCGYGEHFLTITRYINILGENEKYYDEGVFNALLGNADDFIYIGDDYVQFPSQKYYKQIEFLERHKEFLNKDQLFMFNELKDDNYDY